AAGTCDAVAVGEQALDGALALDEHVAGDGALGAIDSDVVGGLDGGGFDAGHGERAGAVIVGDARAVGEVHDVVVAGAAGLIMRGGVEPGEHHAGGGFAAGAEYDDLLRNGRGRPGAGGAGAALDPRQPSGGDAAGFHAAQGLRVIDLGNGAEAQEVVEAAGEVCERVHAARMPRARDAAGSALLCWFGLQRARISSAAQRARCSMMRSAMVYRSASV